MEQNYTSSNIWTCSKYSTKIHTSSRTTSYIVSLQKISKLCHNILSCLTVKFALRERFKENQ